MNHTVARQLHVASVEAPAEAADLAEAIDALVLSCASVGIAADTRPEAYNARAAVSILGIIADTLTKLHAVMLTVADDNTKGDPDLKIWKQTGIDLNHLAIDASARLVHVVAWANRNHANDTACLALTASHLAQLAATRGQGMARGLDA